MCAVPMPPRAGLSATPRTPLDTGQNALRAWPMMGWELPVWLCPPIEAPACGLHWPARRSTAAGPPSVATDPLAAATHGSSRSGRAVTPTSAQDGVSQLAARIVVVRVCRQQSIELGRTPPGCTSGRRMRRAYLSVIAHNVHYVKLLLRILLGKRPPTYERSKNV